MCYVSLDVTEQQTFLGLLEQNRHEWFLGLLHELYDALLDGILVLVEPTVDVVLHLLTVQQCSQLQLTLSK